MRKRIKKKIEESTILKRIESWARLVILPGFEKVPLYDVLKFFIHGLKSGDITSRAAAMSFSFFLALFPSVIFLFTLIPYIPVENFQDQLFLLLKDFMPSGAFEAVESTLDDIIKKPHGGLLSFGFISALYFSTNGFNAMINAFNSSIHKIESRGVWKQRLIALIMVLVQTLVLVVAISSLILSEIVIHEASKIELAQSMKTYLLIFGRWAIIFALFFVLISFTYFLGPDSKARWPFISAGSTFATVMTILTSGGFAYYVNNFGQYNKLYGSIGTLIVVLMWIYINSIILLLGFELNASIHSARKTRFEAHV